MRRVLSNALASADHRWGSSTRALLQEQTVELQQGDLLVSYSDGISEATDNNSQMWDEASIEEVVLANCHKSSSEIVAALVHAADEFAAGAEQADDMTALAVRLR